MDSPVPNTTMFTCNTCGLAFPTAELQRLHMKTDWHRYNLKRRVAGLPPITAEVFAEKILQQQQQEQESQQTGGGKRGGVRQITKKDKKKEEKMIRKQALMNQASHSARADTDSINLERPSSPTGSIASSNFSLGDPINHQTFTDDEASDVNSVADTASINEDTASASGEEHDQQNDEDREFNSEDEDEIDRYIKHKMSKRTAISANTCLISGKVFNTVEEKTAYMTKTYGLYVPEKEFLVDLEGLMTYLGEKVGLGFMCLKCSFQGKSLESVRAHMISKSHVMIPYEEEEEKLEIGDFYDFTSSYKSVTKQSRQSKLRKQVIADEDGWVDEDLDDDFDDVEGPESGSEGDEDLDDYNTAYVDGLGYELALPSGARIGHRSLAKYYRQNLRPDAPLREGAGTVMAVNTRVLLTTRDKNTDLALKDSWKQEQRRTNAIIRKEHKFINNQKYYRDELLQ
ncbi:hypothetical protein NADFUDRAFT_80990 [Nadsonia fulvescens var. elongata DSM 6958]|uniref:C2H2-type domain-containing protein n=1 Tax=Nadsonia fulvescens var. elongata DSM 6958 TaxID=857566 RepID=A0A1E3PR19_9ASCO|nr:hypothetical protein NADFUDRAFT_80990 [Nadsonia fulvescens var. elongata DSM 6958]